MNNSNTHINTTVRGNTMMNLCLSLEKFCTMKTFIVTLYRRVLVEYCFNYCYKIKQETKFILIQKILIWFIWKFVIAFPYFFQCDISNDVLYPPLLTLLNACSRWNVKMIELLGPGNLPRSRPLTLKTGMGHNQICWIANARY